MTTKIVGELEQTRDGYGIGSIGWTLYWPATYHNGPLGVKPGEVATLTPEEWASIHEDERPSLCDCFAEKANAEAEAAAIVAEIERITRAVKP